MAYSLVVFKEETEIREAVVPSGFVVKLFFWSNAFNAVRDLKTES